jgi:hypothetical protein
MFRIATRSTVLGLAVLFGGGCVAAQRGSTQVKYEAKDTSPRRVVPATNDGKYALYKGSDVKPQLVTEVRRGDPIGFEHHGTKVTAVAGTQSFEFPDDSSYYWNYRGK